DLGQDHVKLIDDVRNGREVGFAGENQERVDAFVRNDLSLPQDIDVASAGASAPGGGAIDNLLKPVLEGRPPGCAVHSAHPALIPDLVRIVSGRAEAAFPPNPPGSPAPSQSPGRSTQTAARLLPAHRGGAAAAGSQVAQDLGNITRQRVFNRD